MLNTLCYTKCCLKVAIKLLVYAKIKAKICLNINNNISCRNENFSTSSFAINNHIFSSVALWYVVQRTKLCLDFTCTVHFFHLLACWYYNNYTFGNTITWWFINIVCMTIMCVSGEFLCMRTELRAIPVSMTPKADL